MHDSDIVLISAHASVVTKWLWVKIDGDVAKRKLRYETDRGWLQLRYTNLDGTEFQGSNFPTFFNAHASSYEQQPDTIEPILVASHQFTFTVLELTSNSTEVTVEWDHPMLGIYWSDLISRMPRQWFENVPSRAATSKSPLPSIPRNNDYDALKEVRETPPLREPHEIRGEHVETFPHINWLPEIGPIDQPIDIVAGWILDDSAEFSGFDYHAWAGRIMLKDGSPDRPGDVIGNYPDENRNVVIHVEHPSEIILPHGQILITWAGSRRQIADDGSVLSEIPVGVIIWCKLAPDTRDTTEVRIALTTVLNEVEMTPIHSAFTEKIEQRLWLNAPPGEFREVNAAPDWRPLLQGEVSIKSSATLLPKDISLVLPTSLGSGTQVNYRVGPEFDPLYEAAFAELKAQPDFHRVSKVRLLSNYNEVFERYLIKWSKQTGESINTNTRKERKELFRRAMERWKKDPRKRT